MEKKTTGLILDDCESVFSIIENSPRYWAADPFIIEKGGEVFVFAELYDYVLCRGVIGYCKLENSKKIRWIPVIKESFHLSYPCIIEYDNKIYMLPESGESNELVLYEAIDFPKRWRRMKTLRKNIKFADTTPIPEKANEMAWTYMVDDPYNPRLLLIDLKGRELDIDIPIESPLCSRPAGNAFIYKNKSIRPVQKSYDFHGGYGKCLMFYEYSITDDMKYGEILMKEIRPTDLKYSKQLLLDGMHTYNVSDNYEVIDIKTRRFNLINLIFRILKKMDKNVK